MDDTTEKSGEVIIQDTEKSLFDLAERGTFSQSFLKFNQALDQTIEMATNAMKNDQGIVGVPTGLDSLDERLRGGSINLILLLLLVVRLWVKLL